LQVSTELIDQTIRETGRAAQSLEADLAVAIEQASLMVLMYDDEISWWEARQPVLLWVFVTASTACIRSAIARWKSLRISSPPRYMAI
jgi:hypothetical protein